MFGTSSSKQVGRGYIVLNVIRVMNIISLLLVGVASWIMLVMTLKDSSFYFFDGVSHFITSSIAVFLVVSELSLFPKYFLDYWPTLAPHNGFVFLGMSMIVLGFNILGNLNKSATSVDALGLPMWRVVIASGILSSLMGLFNIITSYAFSENDKTARQVRAHGAVTPNVYEKRLSLPEMSRNELPSYYVQPAERRRSRFPFRFPIRHSQISKPVEASESYIPDVERPPTAMHPANQRPPPPPASSRYSEVSDITRF